MNRKDFLRKSILGSSLLASPFMYSKSSKENTEVHVGFNHLPIKKSKVMKDRVFHKASSRGVASHGWLHSYHSFSFAHYYNPDRMQFGALRVLNDDIIEAAMGFGTHPHNNMEIITIPLEGDLEHKDSMGNTSVIKSGDVQIMSAGTGIQHSEYNHSKEKRVKLLQIWVIPNAANVEPRYDQISLKAADSNNKLEQIVSPNKSDQGVWLHQDAWFHLGNFDAHKKASYSLKKTGNGVYFFLIEGKAIIQGQEMEARDGFGIWNTQDFEIEFHENSKLLIMEVPV